MKNDSETKLNGPLVHRLYQSAVVAGARLTCFVYSQVPLTRSDLGERVLGAAHDDLIALAISGRRLLESTGFVKRAKELTVSAVIPTQLQPTVMLSEIEKVSLWRFMNLLVHSKTLEIASTNADLIFRFERDLSIVEMYAIEVSRRENISPLVFARSEKEELRLYDLKGCVEAFDVCLDEVVAFCARHGVFLGD